MRSAGILLPVSSLPSDYGIGTMGEGAFIFLDFLCDSRQHYWQILPLGHTGFGDSPYQCFSAFAGNPYLIDPYLLYERGYLAKKDVPYIHRNEKIDYGSLYKLRLRLIKKAAENVDTRSLEYNKFIKANDFWLEDYSCFMALKENRNMKPLKAWENVTGNSDETTIDLLENEIKIWKCVQFLFFTQWNNLKRYANARNVEIIGDLPIYVSADSCEMWKNRELFITDERGNPSIVSGCPPDIYSPMGQLWGNPIYDWSYHKQTSYEWWIKRLKKSAEMYDVIRIDHFRGFEDYYGIDVETPNAAVGKWYKGPSKDFISAVNKSIPNLKIIAEDLGNVTDEVRELLRFSGYPGMKILQFAFDGTNSEYLPHNFKKNCVAYTGTHDNPTMKQWSLYISDRTRKNAEKYLSVNNGDEIVNACIRALYASCCDTVIIPMQDWLNLGSEARINVPSMAFGNWTWRLKGPELNTSLSRRIAEMTKLYFRNQE